ncbi:hypothetical protein GF386_05465 [Candidatus Pacearchaeota archaeon]|nr:hypothetical protein [Candidatus Pacearchaeota archaeon]MBD3283548.1 hypothetical protein [Candidatus Pacearchaeota archaeon]
MRKSLSKPKISMIRGLMDMLVLPDDCNGHAGVSRFSEYLGSIRSEENLEEMLYTPEGCANILASIVSIFMLSVKRSDISWFEKTYECLASQVPDERDRGRYLRKVQRFISAANEFISNAEASPLEDVVYVYVDSQFSRTMEYYIDNGLPLGNARETYDRQARALENFRKSVITVERYKSCLGTRFIYVGCKRTGEDYGKAAIIAAGVNI